jgi:hypothetical protein
MNNSATNRVDEVTGILDAYHKLDDSSYCQSLAAEVHSLKEKYSALQRDYDHMITQFERLSR